MSNYATRRLAGLTGLMLTVGVAGHVEGSSMMNVESKLMEKLREVGEGSVPVLIVCGDACKAVRMSLERADIKITSTDSMVLGSIGADLRADQVETVRLIPGIISAIELDEEARALGSQ